ncbi:MAG: flavodoxin domain-containing protein [Nitrososphaerota archaeon]
MVSSVIICCSVHRGNTLKVARVISQILDTRIYRPEELDPVETTEKYQLIGLGSGIYYGKSHPSILKFAERFPQRPGKICVRVLDERSPKDAGLPRLS